MPTRDEMLASIRSANQSQQTSTPTRDEMLAAIRSRSEDQGIISQGIDMAARLADAPGGFVRTGLAEMAGMGKAALQGQNPLTAPQVVNEQDVANAAQGHAPRSAELMERLGVPAGPTIPGAGVPMSPIPAGLNLRDVGGFVGDVVTDPLTTLGRALKPGVAEKVLNPISHATEASGTALYKSGLKKVDQQIAEKGAKPLSDLLMEKGVAGTSKQVRSEAADIAKNVKAERDAIYKTVDEAGATVDPSVALKEAEEEAIRVGVADPAQMKDMEAILQTIDDKKKMGPVPISQASEWKTNLYNSFPANAYDKSGKLTGPSARIEKQVAHGLKTGIEASADTVAPGLGEQISKRNEELHTLITSRQPLKKMATSATATNIVTPVDAMIGTATALASHNPTTVAAAMTAKKLADLSKTTWFRTQGGQALRSLGQTKALDPIARRALIDMEQPKQKSPWEKFK